VLATLAVDFTSHLVPRIKLFVLATKYQKRHLSRYGGGLLFFFELLHELCLLLLTDTESFRQDNGFYEQDNSDDFLAALFVCGIIDILSVSTWDDQVIYSVFMLRT
jgi:hydrogenase-4 membrane subunit HyfE